MYLFFRIMAEVQVLLSIIRILRSLPFRSFLPMFKGLSLPWNRAQRNERAASRTTRSLSPLEKARSAWESTRGADELIAYLQAEGDRKARELAVFQMLFLGCKNVAKESWEVMPELTRDSMRKVDPQIRLTLPDDHYDHAFWQNIVCWRHASENTHSAMCLCFNRMSAVESVFGDKISHEAIEVGISFVLRTMRDWADMLGDDSIGDPVYELGLRIAEQFARRRPTKQLTSDELRRLRDAVIYTRPHFAYTVSRSLSGLA